MVYTVKQLAKLAKVSVRTLHFYHKINLLTPAYCGANGYRYYGREELLVLQQILFYKALGLSLDSIKAIINCNNFDKIQALNEHRQSLIKRLNQMHQLIMTIDKTIATLTGETTMNDAELYYGFDSQKQQAYEKQLIASGYVSESNLHAAKQRTQSWAQQDWQKFSDSLSQIHSKLINAMHLGLAVDSQEVQAIIQEHYTWIKQIWIPTKTSYLGLSELYQTADFEKFYNQLDPNLLAYLVQAMQTFANERLD